MFVRIASDYLFAIGIRMRHPNAQAADALVIV